MRCFFYQSNEIRRRVPGQSGFGKVWVRGDEVFRLVIKIREIAPAAAGNSGFFLPARSARSRIATRRPAFAGLNRAEESRGARAKNNGGQICGPL